MQSQTATAVPLSRASKIIGCAATWAAHRSCPPTCPLRVGCFARFGLCAHTTRRLNAACTPRTTALDVALCEAAALGGLRVHPGRPLRLHISGDCATPQAARIVAGAARRYLVRGGGPVWACTHAWREVPRAAWGYGINILASIETLADLPLARAQGYASAALVVAEHPADGRAWRAPDGTKVVPCPSQTHKDVICATCRLCMRPTPTVISLAAHGAGAGHVIRTLAIVGNSE
jgi:hypothetical protein